RKIKVLNLFAYTGGATVACLKSGASVVHVDSSRGMVDWAKENVEASGLKDRPIRYIVDDVVKFVKREIRRGNKYDVIIMDPPSYGRGANGEVWDIEKDLDNLVKLCKEVLSEQPLFFLINSYTAGLSCEVLTNLYKSILSEGKKVILAGDSSGGGLCLALCQSFEKSGILQPEKVITLAPWVDVTMSNPEITKIERVDPKLNSNVARVLGEFWANGQDLKDYKISPLYGDFKGLNNVYIFIGTRDILYPDNLLLYNKLQKEGVNAYLTVGTNLNHVYPVYPTVEGKKAIEQISKIISS
ncbi:MAG: alpha/beta hydrolase fold domain-containing protein, partial [Clostridia bacterium]|nr:alpha/beta hydrolase fold domain-containing protein [Clostridia bacterium]